MAAVAPLIGLGLSLASSIPQWLTGDDQEDRARALEKNLVRPDFTIPGSELESLQLAKDMASTGMPGLGAAQGRLDQTTANTIATIERLGVGGPTSINAASRAYGNQLNAENDLAVKDAEFRQRNKQLLGQELDENAQWQLEEWNWDKRLPYENTAAAIQALREGSMRNKNAAWKDLLGTGANFLLGMGGDDGNPFAGLFSGGKSGSGGSMSNSLRFTSVDPRTSDPSSPFFKTEFGQKPLFESLSYGGTRV